jgi:diacylglycerol kinase
MKTFKSYKQRYGGLKSFSFYARAKSFKHPVAGIRQFIFSEPNSFIHLAATFIAASVAIALRVTPTEAIAIIIVTGFVWSAELFNTAVEKMADFVCPEQNASIKYIKDISAAAVLVAAVIALATGCIIFIPKIILLCK